MSVCVAFFNPVCLSGKAITKKEGLKALDIFSFGGAFDVNAVPRVFTGYCCYQANITFISSLKG